MAGIVLVPAIFFIMNFFWGKPVFISHFFFREMLKSLGEDPQLVTKVKVPVLHYFYRGKLNDLSLESLEKQQLKLINTYQKLEKYDESTLSPENRLSKKLMQWHLKKDIDGIPFAQYSFFINPFNGYQNQLPAYLDTYHRIESKADAKAYLSRLEQIPEYFDQIMERSEVARKQGVMPPKHLIVASLNQMKEFIAQKKEDNILYTSFKVKLLQQKKIKNPQPYLDKVLDIMAKSVYPAYEKLIAYQSDVLPFALTESNASVFPDGDKYYRYLIRHHTGMDLAPDSIHQFGKNEVDRIKNEMVNVLQTLFPDKKITDPLDEMRKLKSEPSYLYPNDSTGRAACLRDFDRLLKTVYKKLPEWFVVIPTSQLMVKRVPQFKESASSFAYYEVAQMGGDGSGTFYVRLDDLTQKPKFEMPTLAYHEGWPGHHLQLSYHLENKSLALYDKRFTNNGYIEGWALYVERLMYEQGMYQLYPEANLGRLEAEIMRATRLVVDTGIHRYGWSKKEAENFMYKHTAMSYEEVSTEIDRYIADPGQALSYTLGMHGILEIRNKAKLLAGKDFDLKNFHELILSHGILPMHLLEELVIAYYQNEGKYSNDGKKR